MSSPRRGERGKGATPPVELLGRNGVFQVARRKFREEVFLLLTPWLRVRFTSKVAATLGGKGRVNSWLRFLPSRMRIIDLRYGPIPVWRPHRAEPPSELRGVVGVVREEEVAEAAFRDQPLHDFVRTHVEAFRYLQQFAWNYIPPALPGLLRGYLRIDSLEATPARPKRTEDPAEMSELVRAEAARLGFSAVGFARHDPRYTYAEYAAEQLANVIVCVVEQDFDATQTAPSGRAERSAFRAYEELMMRIPVLTEFLRQCGYNAAPQDFSGQAMVIHYGVEAGLGQLGLNGQLLTPQAGSRCRIALITTDAPIQTGEPVDYGIEKLCDSCQACVRRCPVGAIPNSRKSYRGVVKAKIKTERCLPTMIQTHGCAVCMKVCPVQRYGLDRVQRHFDETGEVLGRGSDELEGFAWPLDGRHYEPGRKPRVTPELTRPDGFIFDKSRKAPLADDASPFQI